MSVPRAQLHQPHAVGRPRCFCPDAALAAALTVFQTRGFEGASLTDLTRAMGINRPSLYATYGNKEQLFRKAVDKYAAAQSAGMRDALALPTAGEAIRAILCSASRRSGPGCLLVSGALVGGAELEPVRKELVHRRAGFERALRKRFQQAVGTGELESIGQANDLARLYSTLLHGLAVRAAGRASAAELKRVAKTAMGLWPGKSASPIMFEGSRIGLAKRKGQNR